MTNKKVQKITKIDEIFDAMDEHNYEQIIFFRDKSAQLKGITCIHNTTLGTATGGTRFWNYSTTSDALFDVMRLARGMTFKNSGAGINMGGCKNVIIGDPSKIKSEKLMRAYGRHINTLGGRVNTGEDVNVTTQDCAYMRMETKYIAGLEGKSGNPSIVTGYGIYLGVKATLKAQYGSDDVSKFTFAVQGAGQTGYYLIKNLIENNAKKIYFTEFNPAHIQRMKNEHPEVEFVTPDKIYGLKVDVFCPCALGGLLNDDTIPKIAAKAIAGSANNILLDEVKHDNMLKARKILYAPDFIINAGGVINVYHEIIGYNKDAAIRDVEKIYPRLLQIFDYAKKHNIGTQAAAIKYAQNRIDDAGEIGKNFSTQFRG
jgi:leucine dehydrogenase